MPMISDTRDILKQTLQSVPRSWMHMALYVFLFYGWVALNGVQGRDELPMAQYYNRQTDAFLKGQLHFLIKSDPRIAKNPYDYDRYWDYIHREQIIDLSLYQGRIYSYFGVVPVGIVYLPYRLITGGQRLPDRAVCFFFSSGIFLFASAIIFRLRKVYWPGVPEGMASFACLVAGFANLTARLIKPASVYEVTILSGLFFFLGALALLFQYLTDSKQTLGKLIIISLGLGLAAGCRPNYLVSDLVVLVFSGMVISRRFRSDRLRRLLALSAPYLGCVLLLGVYNAVRFGDCLEFGTRWQITLYNRYLCNYLFDPSRVFLNTYFFFIQPPVFNDTFPYVHAASILPHFLRIPAGAYGRASTIGIIPETPFIGIIVLAPFLYILKAKISLKSFLGRLMMAPLVLTGIYYFGVRGLVRWMGSWNNTVWLSEIYYFLQKIREQVPVIIIYSVFLFLSVFFWMKRHDRGFYHRAFPRLEANVLAMVCAISILIYLPHSCLDRRYVTDSAIFLILLAVIFWFYLYEYFRDDQLYSNVFCLCACILGIVSIIFGIASVLE